MPKLIASLPKYSLHKASGQAVVTLCGKDFYLGLHNSKVSRLEYDRLVSEWIQNGRQLPQNSGWDLAVVEVINAFRKHADAYYVKDGKRTREAEIITEILVRFVKPLYGRTLATDFGPLALKAVRQKMVEAGHSRGVVNKNVDRIRRMFRWAAAEEMIPVTVSQALATVPGLRKGRTPAREPQPIQPVADEVVDATLPHLPTIVADMVRLQRLTGARPGEVCLLRPIDVDRSKPVWEYRPESHKTQHHDKERVIFIGPKAQDVLLSYLLRSGDAYCFSPAETEQKRREACHAARKTPANQGNRPGTNRKTEPKQRPRDRYTKDSYNKAIQRACEIAFGMPKELRKSSKKLSEDERKRLQKRAAEWRGEHCWSPNQLRHAAGTDVRRQFGLEGAQVVLGHAKADTTQIYAERDRTLAAEIMQKIG